MNDCAWCHPGEGESICDDCLAALFAQSADLAASGRYLAETSEQGNQNSQTEQQPSQTNS